MSRNTYTSEISNLRSELFQKELVKGREKYQKNLKKDIVRKIGGHFKIIQKQKAEIQMESEFKKIMKDEIPKYKNYLIPAKIVEFKNNKLEPLHLVNRPQPLDDEDKIFDQLLLAKDTPKYIRIKLEEYRNSGNVVGKTVKPFDKNCQHTFYNRGARKPKIQSRHLLLNRNLQPQIMNTKKKNKLRESLPVPTIKNLNK